MLQFLIRPTLITRHKAIHDQQTCNECITVLHSDALDQQKGVKNNLKQGFCHKQDTLSHPLNNRFPNVLRPEQWDNCAGHSIFLYSLCKSMSLNNGHSEFHII